MYAITNFKVVMFGKGITVRVVTSSVDDANAAMRADGRLALLMECGPFAFLAHKHELGDALPDQKCAKSWTRQEVDAVNRCGRYILVHVLRATTDCTLNGITSRRDTFYLPHPQGPLESPDYEGILEILPPAFDGCPLRVRPAAAKGSAMCGGNYVTTSDSRFAKLYGAPLSVHDRVES
jgi:hypothetical protein